MATTQITKSNSMFTVETGQHSDFWKLYADDSWEKETFKVFDRFVNPSYSCVDIGAWIGPTVLYMAGKAKKVYAFEPDRQAFADLVNNINLNEQLKPKITLFDKAVTATACKMPLYTDNFSGNSISSTIETRHTLSSYEVDGIGVDQLKDLIDFSDVNLVKVDIEGGEYALIPRLAEFLGSLNTPPTLYISLHMPYLFNGGFLDFAVKIKQKKEALKLGKTLMDSLKFYNFCYWGSGEEVKNRDQIVRNRDLCSFVVSQERW